MVKTSYDVVDFDFTFHAVVIFFDLLLYVDSISWLSKWVVGGGVYIW